MAQQASASQQLAETTQADVASHSLPSEPCSKKRVSQSVEETGPSPGRKDK